MNKAIVFVVALAVSACIEHEWNDSVIMNTSAFPVSCKFSNTETLEIPAGESVAFETAAYQRLEQYAPEKRVAFAYTADDNGYTGTFTVRPSWAVTVRNTLTEPATLTADGWMDELEIPATGGGDPVETLVYTAEPVFSVASPLGAAVVYTKTEAEDGVVTFQVTIR